MNTICIMCPMGCPLTIEDKDGKVTVSGNTCKRGELYGVQEYTSPKRVVTSLVRTDDERVVSVKTAAPVDKADIFEVLRLLKDVRITPPVHIGDVVVKSVLGSGVDVVATSNLK